MEEIYLSKPEIDDLSEEPLETLSRTIEELVEAEWTFPEIYNRLRALFRVERTPTMVVPVDDELFKCSCCTRRIRFRDSWAPGSE